MQKSITCSMMHVEDAAAMLIDLKPVLHYNSDETHSFHKVRVRGPLLQLMHKENP